MWSCLGLRFTACLRVRERQVPRLLVSAQLEPDRYSICVDVAFSEQAGRGRLPHFLSLHFLLARIGG